MNGRKHHYHAEICQRRVGEKTAVFQWSFPRKLPGKFGWLASASKSVDWKLSSEERATGCLRLCRGVYYPCSYIGIIISQYKYPAYEPTSIMESKSFFKIAQLRVAVEIPPGKDRIYCLCETAFLFGVGYVSLVELEGFIIPVVILPVCCFVDVIKIRSLNEAAWCLSCCCCYLLFLEGDFLRILPWDSSPFFTTIWGICSFYTNPPPKRTPPKKIRP